MTDSFDFIRACGYEVGTLWQDDAGFWVDPSVVKNQNALQQDIDAEFQRNPEKARRMAARWAQAWRDDIKLARLHRDAGLPQPGFEFLEE